MFSWEAATGTEQESSIEAIDAQRVAVVLFFTLGVEENHRPRKERPPDNQTAGDSYLVDASVDSNCASVALYESGRMSMPARCVYRSCSQLPRLSENELLLRRQFS
jgi:hypothetical protein